MLRYSSYFIDDVRKIKKVLFFVLFSIIIFYPFYQSLAQSTTVTFNYTGSVQSWTVPPCVTSITVVAAGADGGGTYGGNGAVINATLTVTPGQVLQIRVGGSGSCPGAGYNGGGAGANANTTANRSCGGGGATDIRISPYALANRVLVAAGGGGMGGGTSDATGGAGGCASGGAGILTFGVGGGAGTQTSGGSAGPPWSAYGNYGGAGSLGTGGSGASDPCYNVGPGGGGGGGYYGGGGGGSDCYSSSPYGGGSGGGGSSLVPSGGSCSSGSNNGAGYLTITYTAISVTATASNTGPYCVGSTIQLNAGTVSGATYSWTGPNGFTSSSQNPTISNATAANAGTYSVTVAVGTCTGTATTTVVVNPLPTVNAGTDVAICQGASTTLSATGNAANYSWSPATGLSPSNTASVTASPSSTTTYTVTGTSANGCLNTDQVVVTVNPLPTINAGADVAFCTGASTTLTASGGSTYSWSPVSGLSASNTASVTASPSSTTTYTVTGTNANGCVNTDQVVVTVNALPVVNAGTDQTVCQGTAVTLSGSGASTYSWDNGVTNGTAFSPAVGTVTYTVTGTSSAGCINTDQVVVTVNPTPVISVNDVSICTGSSASLTATGGSTYSWSPSTGLSASTGANVTATPSSTTNYTVTGTSAAGCTASDIATVTVLTNAPVNAGPDVSVCTGASTVLTASGAATYNWNNGLGTGNNFSVSPASTTTYTVVGTDASGCVGTDAVTITVNPLPTVNAGADQTVCEGTAVTLTGSGASTYSWNNGITNGIAFTPAVGTVTYTVTGTSAAGCANTDQVVVTVNPLPVVNAGSDQTVCAGTSVTLTASGANAYSWDNGVSNGVPFTPASTQTYTVTGTSSAGCLNTDQIVVTVNVLPAVNAGTDQTVCDGTAVTLTGSGASTYSWNNGVNNGVAFTPAAGTVTYTLTGTSSAGCVNTDQVVVTVNPNPTPVISGSLYYCTGNSATLSTSASYSSYSWSTGATTSTVTVTTANNPISVTVTNSYGCTATSATVNVTESSTQITNSTVEICQGQSAVIHGTTQTAAGTYSQTYTSTVTGCDSTSNVTLVVHALPSVNAGTDQSVCTGVSTTLTASGAQYYSWNNGISNGVPFTQAVGTITYIVTGTDVYGCVNTDQVVVTVNALPLVSAGTDQTVCAGTAVTLSGSGAATYTWNNGVSNGVSFTTSVTQTYTVSGTDANGCVNTDQVLVTVNANPTVNAGSDQTICVGASVTLSGSGASTYSWDNSVTNGVVFYPSITAVYTVTGTNATGCTGTDQVTVTVNSLPVVNAGSDIAICIGASTTISVSGSAISFNWTPVTGLSSSSGTTVTANPVSTTTYTVSGTDVNGCVNSDQIVVTVNALPAVNAGVDQDICSGNQVTLSGSGASTYTWNNGVTNGVAFVPALTQTYTVSGTDINGCVNTDQVTVILRTPPTVFAGNDLTICENQVIVMSASGASTYTWSNGVLNNGTFVPPVGNSTYSVVGTDVYGCIGTDQFDVLVNALPVVAFSADTLTGCIPLTVQFTNNSTSFTDSYWSFGNGDTQSTTSSSVNTTYTNEGCYDVSLTISDANGCSNNLYYANMICVIPYPVASFTYSPEQLSVIDMTAEFQNTSTNAVSYLWNFGDAGNSGSTVENPSFTYPEGNVEFYTVTLQVENELGCQSVVSQDIPVRVDLLYFVPNTFTPDGDQYNQTFKPIFTSGFDPMDFNFYIFDRWGEMIFESHDANVGWDGTYGENGEISRVQDGVYTWKIEFKTAANDARKVVLGHVNLLR